MSTKPETTFYQSVHRHLPRDLYAVKMNNPYVGGIPDCWYSGTKDDLWVEYKFLVLPKRDTTLIDLDVSALQAQWLGCRFLEGRNVAVIVGCKEGGVYMRPVSWEQKWTAEAFKAALQSRVELANEIVRVTMR